MGRKKNKVVSYLCGVLFRKKPPPVEDADDDFEEPLSSPTTSASAFRGDGTLSPLPPPAPATKPSSPDHSHHHQSLPMPPGVGVGGGNHHMRTASTGYNLQHRRSNSGVSKLVSSMSLRVMGGGVGGGGGGGSVGLNRVKERTRYFKQEDSVWKKTIILGERCRVPDEDEDDFKVFDEKGNKIITYHPKSHSGLLQYSRPNTTLDSHDFSRKL